MPPDKLIPTSTSDLDLNSIDLCNKALVFFLYLDPKYHNLEYILNPNTFFIFNLLLIFQMFDCGNEKIFFMKVLSSCFSILYPS